MQDPRGLGMTQITYGSVCSGIEATSRPQSPPAPTEPEQPRSMSLESQSSPVVTQRERGRARTRKPRLCWHASKGAKEQRLEVWDTPNTCPRHSAPLPAEHNWRPRSCRQCRSVDSRPQNAPGSRDSQTTPPKSHGETNLPKNAPTDPSTRPTEILCVQKSCPGLVGDWTSI